MPIPVLARRRSCIFLLLCLPLIPAAASAQFALQGLSAGQLRDAFPAAIPEVSASAAVIQETYPDFEQDRKPAVQLSNSGGERLLGGVRFDRDRATGVYDWSELRLQDARLEEVYWGYKSGGVGHSFLLFRFKDGAWDKAGRPVSGLVIEVLPWKKKGESFSPFGAGLSGHYPLIWNTGTWDSFLQTAVERDNAHVDVYPLKISREEKLRLLDAGIKEAVRDLGGEKYNTFFNSCSTNALKVFTAATGHHLLVGKTLPSAVVEHLKVRGFLGKRERTDASNWRRQ